MFTAPFFFGRLEPSLDWTTFAKKIKIFESFSPKFSPETQNFRLAVIPGLRYSEGNVVANYVRKIGIYPIHRF